VHAFCGGAFRNFHAGLEMDIYSAIPPLSPSRIVFSCTRRFAAGFHTSESIIFRKWQLLLYI
jgi:hypothetical protein